ncbi:DUF4405 domain-containing protein [Aestuariivirga sp.]|uniref:DUF4405 domain-containing protein n=1 Tax=Aestuariivirga sp. TaxID=2650926 RepID=UPI0039E4D19D
MPDILNRYATPFVTGFFLISLISGVALFFHVGTSAFREMHEILSLVLILPFVLHVWKNWRSLLNYFRRTPFWIGSAVSLVAALAFAWPALTGSAAGTAGGPPPFALSNAVLKAPVAEVAPVLNTTPDDLLAGLKAKGFTVTTTDEALSDIGTKSGKDTMELAAALVALAK